MTKTDLILAFLFVLCFVSMSIAWKYGGRIIDVPPSENPIGDKLALEMSMDLSQFKQPGEEN
jgi:hypothetical protein